VLSRAEFLMRRTSEGDVKALGNLPDCAKEARAAIERAEAVKPDLDLNDQVEAKRVNECPDCETETDTTRNNGANGDEYVEYCMNDDCEWETKLGTVTESLS